MERVGEPMAEQRLHPAPRGEDPDRPDVAGGGVAVASRGDVGANLLEHAAEGVEPEHPAQPPNQGSDM